MPAFSLFDFGRIIAFSEYAQPLVCGQFFFGIEQRLVFEQSVAIDCEAEKQLGSFSEFIAILGSFS